MLRTGVASAAADNGSSRCHLCVAASREICAPTCSHSHRYGGACLDAATTMLDAAHGGMILATASAFGQLPVEALNSQLLALHMGDHALGKHGSPRQNPEAGQAWPVYQIVPRSLLFRAPILGDVRSEHVLSYGCLQAP